MILDNLILILLLIGLIFILIILSFTLYIEFSSNKKDTSILMEDYNTSEQLIDGAKYFTDTLIKDHTSNEATLISLYEKSLDELTKKSLTSFESNIDSIKAQNDEKLTQYLSNLNNLLEKSIQQYNESLNKDIHTMTDKSTEAFTNIISSMDSEVSKYKEAQKEFVNRRINMILNDTVSAVLSESIDMKVHEKIIKEKLKLLNTL